jgi:hypothetical protein
MNVRQRLTDQLYYHAQHVFVRGQKTGQRISEAANRETSDAGEAHS